MTLILELPPDVEALLIKSGAWPIAPPSLSASRQEGITDVLAHDHHFVQAGFVALLRSP